MTMGIDLGIGLLIIWISILIGITGVELNVRRIIRTLEKAGLGQEDAQNPVEQNPTHPKLLPVEEYARRYNFNLDNTRDKLKTHQIPGVYRDGQWYVAVMLETPTTDS